MDCVRPSALFSRTTLTATGAYSVTESAESAVPATVATCFVSTSSPRDPRSAPHFCLFLPDDFVARIDSPARLGTPETEAPRAESALAVAEAEIDATVVVGNDTTAAMPEVPAITIVEFVDCSRSPIPHLRSDAICRRGGFPG